MEKVNPRCSWCRGITIYENYHDHEWGQPVLDEQKMFEFLLLETFQAGLSWITVLKKREDFRQVFHDFNPERVAKMSAAEIEAALHNPRIIRNKAKILAAIHNAKLVTEMHEQGNSLVDFFWSKVDYTPIQNDFESMSDIPAKTSLAEDISKALKKMGFKFVGPTVIYAHMQATGIVNDHITSCPSHPVVRALGKGLK